MRSLAVAILTIGAILAAEPVRAQKYDPAFPFCMYSVEWGGSPRYDCSFHTIDQCRASASGLGGSCDPNPYYVGATASRGRQDKQYRRRY